MTIKNDHKTNETVELIKQLYSIADSRPVDEEAILELLSEDFKDHNNLDEDRQITDRDFVKGVFRELAVGFPDGKHQFEMLEPLADNKGMVYWEFTGTNSGSFFGAPASGNTVSYRGVDIFRVRDGKFTDIWHIEELLSLNNQMEK